LAERAAAGQTNRAIAEALRIAPKTVELHLRNAYRKLGARNRGDLPDLLELGSVVIHQPRQRGEEGAALGG
jgi:FixJ family two-component response regulator